MMDQHFTCQITHLDGSYMIWVGIDAESPPLGNLSLAVNTKYEKNPTLTTLIGDGLDDGSGMAQRLSKKCGAMVFLSCNLDGIEDASMLAVYIERQIAARLVS